MEILHKIENLSSCLTGGCRNCLVRNTKRGECIDESSSLATSAADCLGYFSFTCRKIKGGTPSGETFAMPSAMKLGRETVKRG